MKGFVPTPSNVVDRMIALLFRDRVPSSASKVLDPGCGSGAFIEGVVRWCAANGAPLPKIIGIERNPQLALTARKKFAKYKSVTIEIRDFLKGQQPTFDFIVGNPPYVSIIGLTEREKSDYRKRFEAAVERFDLYILFYEQALKLLASGGRLVFITPEKFMYVGTCHRLRELMISRGIEEIHLIDESTFASLTTYPAISVLDDSKSADGTRITLRNGHEMSVVLPRDGSSWLPSLSLRKFRRNGALLVDACSRISCGVATGADSVFVKYGRSVEPGLRQFAHPTISGRELNNGADLIGSPFVMLTPYDENGELLPEHRLGPLRDYLLNADVRSRLLARTCVRRKMWYSFHENPPLREILRPKILCRDVTSFPQFWIDRKGLIVPRHSVYYIVPKNESILQDLADYLNSAYSREWLSAHCQRAANGYLRLQSHVLKMLPIPSSLGAVEESVALDSGSELKVPTLSTDSL